jgi:hypothetical protein
LLHFWQILQLREFLFLLFLFLSLHFVSSEVLFGCAEKIRI